jgi:hypothetical protein
MSRKMTAFDIKPDAALANQRVWAEVDEGIVPGRLRSRRRGCYLARRADD